MIAALVPLIVLGLMAAGIVAIVAAVRKSPATKGYAAAGAARRLVAFGLLFVLVVIAAIGVTGLLTRVLESGDALAGSDIPGLARALAFTLIAGPLAGVLWWFLWRGIDDEEERSSVAWSLYLAAMSTVALITAATSLLITITILIDGNWRPGTASVAVVWVGVWIWHRRMANDPGKGPTSLTDLAVVAGSTYGLLVAVGGGVTALGTLLGAALESSGGTAIAGDPWWIFTMQSLVWAVGGFGVWWWHWVHSDGRHLETILAEITVVLVGIAGASILTLGGAATTVFSLLRLGIDRSDPVADIVAPLAPSVSALAIGGLVWGYHRMVVAHRSESTREAKRLTTAGIGLVAAASGIGVIVNSILDALSPGLAGSGGRELLLAGVSALVVGGPVWWATWQPTRPATEPEAVGSTGRRIYLVAVFGLGAVVALITLLVIGFRLFEFALDDISGGSLVDRIRAPFGLLVATGLVAGYHYPVWKRDRTSISEAQPMKKVTHVILVTGSDPEPLKQVIHEVTGAAVTIWMRSDVAPDGPSREHVSAALEGVAGGRVMVVTGPGARIDVIPLHG